jgi:outer membrane lipopolysaccharide assembly protein LptE/RlpB
MNNDLQKSLNELLVGKPVVLLARLHQALTACELQVRRKPSNDLSLLSRLQGEGDGYSKLALLVKTHLDKSGFDQVSHIAQEVQSAKDDQTTYTLRPQDIPL